MLPEEAAAAGTESKLRDRYRRFQEYRHQHPGTEIAAFFAAGFLFDIVTLTRIDNLANLVQQGLYLALLAGLMVQEERYGAGVAVPPPLIMKAWRYSEDAIHFLLGSLLSVFTLFYLKSTSGLASVLFLSFLCALLVANELPRFRERGPIVRFGLLSLCLTTYLALLLPLVAGFLSAWLFVAAVALSCAALGWLARRLAGWTHDAPGVRRRMAVPAFAVQGLLAAAYFAGIIPPVPLSVQFIGIYHEVVAPGHEEAPAAPQQASVTGGPVAARTYRLKHLRPWWKVWHHGDQDFAARPGDVIYCFARVFAPNGFRDAVYLHWWARGGGGVWEDQGRARLDISGGRDEGYRAYATKRNYHPGRWRVEIETEDGRDLGVIHFEVTNDTSSEPREFAVDRL